MAQLLPKNQLNPFAAGTAEADPTAEQAQRELAMQIPDGLNVDVASCFPEVGGWRVTRANKARLRYLVGAEHVLRECLHSEETIRYVCLALEQVWWESLVAGHWAMLLNSSVLVATDERVLLIHSDRKGRPSRYLNQIPVSAISQVKGFLHRCTIVVGKQARRFNVGYGDRNNLKRVLPEKNPAAHGGAEYLCPACFTAAAEHVELCASCGTAFKSPKTAAFRSLLLPGLGTWYVGDTGVAVLQMVRGVLLWLIMLGLVVFASGEDDGDVPVLLGIFGFALVLIYGLDSLFARAAAKKGLIALDLKMPSPTRR